MIYSFQSKEKHGSLLRLPAGVNLSAITLNNSSANGQAQARTGYISPVQALKKSENALAKLRFKSDAIVGKVGGAGFTLMSPANAEA